MSGEFLIFARVHSTSSDLCLWWRPNSCGYTQCLEDAGRYTEEDAKRKASGCTPGDHVAVPLDVALKAARTFVRRDDLSAHVAEVYGKPMPSRDACSCGATLDVVLMNKSGTVATVPAEVRPGARWLCPACRLAAAWNRCPKCNELVDLPDEASDGTEVRCCPGLDLVVVELEGDTFTIRDRSHDA